LAESEAQNLETISPNIGKARKNMTGTCLKGKFMISIKVLDLFCSLNRNKNRAKKEMCKTGDGIIK